LRAQSAVAIDILLMAPMRALNLCNLSLTRHLRWRETKDGHRYVIEIGAAEVKNNRNLTYPLPPSTSQRIRDYIDVYRPILVEGPNEHLFPGRDGRAKDQSCLSRQITRAMFDQAGIRLTPHQFRHVGAKLLLDTNPGAYDLVRRVLGHASTSTTYDVYSGGESKAAVEHYDEVILKIGNKGSKPPPSGLRRQLLRQRSGRANKRNPFSNGRRK